MKRERKLSLVAALSSFFVLLFGLGAGHALLTTSAMSAMGKHITQNQCQASCLSQSNVVAPEQKNDIENKDIDPQPAEPYYLAFAGVGWTTAITVAAAYLLKYLRWRPPDIFSLYCCYRI